MQPVHIWKGYKEGTITYFSNGQQCKEDEGGVAVCYIQNGK